MSKFWIIGAVSLAVILTTGCTDVGDYETPTTSTSARPTPRSTPTPVPLPSESAGPPISDPPLAPNPSMDPESNTTAQAAALATEACNVLQRSNFNIASIDAALAEASRLTADAVSLDAHWSPLYESINGYAAANGSGDIQGAWAFVPTMQALCDELGIQIVVA